MAASFVAQLEDLLVLLALTELKARAREGGVEQWLLDCARRAISTNIEALGAARAKTLRAALQLATRRLRGEVDDDELAVVLAQLDAIRGQIGVPGGIRKPADAVIQTLLCIRGDVGPEHAAATARQAFAEPEPEAEAQLRRLLTRTGLLPSGAELLVRLDYAESLGRMPTDPDERAWLESRRSALMLDDEHSRFSVTARLFELVFLAELTQLRQEQRQEQR